MIYLSQLRAGRINAESLSCRCKTPQRADLGDKDVLGLLNDSFCFVLVGVVVAFGENGAACNPTKMMFLLRLLLLPLLLLNGESIKWKESILQSSNVPTLTDCELTETDDLVLDDEYDLHDRPLVLGDWQRANVSANVRRFVIVKAADGLLGDIGGRL